MKLLSLTCVVVLISCAFAEEPLKKDCKLTWDTFENFQLKGLKAQAGIENEAACVKLCETTENCWNIDWNFKDSTCWFGDVHNSPKRTPDNTVNHWDLNCEVKTTPAPTPAPTTAPPTPAPTTAPPTPAPTTAPPTPAPTTAPPTPAPTTAPPTPAPTTAPPAGGDCTEIHRKFPDAKSNVYSLAISGKSVPAYCDMDTAGGGWTVFQRRQDGSVDFKRKWDDYAKGFGDLNGEFWWGNDYISTLTNARTYRLRVDLVNWKGVYTYAEYNNFKVAGAADKYKMTYSDCSYFGNAGNALGGDVHGAQQAHNGMKFSTIDNDNDNAPDSCAETWNGAWWYNHCHSANLNGQYNNTVSGQGVNWNDWTYSFKVTEMKLRSP